MKKVIFFLAVALIYATVHTSAQTYTTIPFNTASENFGSYFSVDQVRDHEKIIDNDINSSSYAYALVAGYTVKGKSWQVNYNTPTYIDEIAVYRRPFSYSGVERYPTLNIKVNGISVGTVLDKKNDAYSFKISEVNKTVSNANIVIDAPIDYSSGRFALQEVQGRRYHRLTLKLAGSGIRATHSALNIPATQSPITILSTQANVSYAIKSVSAVNTKFSHWVLNGVSVSRDVNYTHSHTVDRIAAEATMTALTMPCVPIFARNIVQLNWADALNYANPNVLTTENPGEVKYTSSNTSIIAVDEYTGNVTITGIGTATITASQKAEGIYGPLTASYVINVADRNLVVESNTTENTDISFPNYSSIIINSDASLNVVSPTYTNDLILRTALNGLSYDIDKASKLKVSSIHIEREFNNNNFYSFTLPFDCPMSDLIAANEGHIGVYGEAWIIREYDEQLRVSNQGQSSSWTMVPSSGTIRANKGYTVATSRSVDGTRVIKCVKAFGTLTSLAEGADIDVVASPSTEGAAVDRGWNLIAPPYYSKGMYTISSGDTAEFYISIPIDEGGSGYYQLKSSEYAMSPGECVFVQVANSGKLSFAPVSSSAPAPAAAPGQRRNPLEFPLSIINDAGEEDKTTVIHNAKAPKDEYYIMYDLEKLSTYGTLPRIYVIDHDVKLVYSAINCEEYSEVAIGLYVPEAGNYTLRFPENEYLSLYDAESEQNINVDEYQFYTDSAGHIVDRFYVRINKIPTSADNVEMEEDASRAIVMAKDHVITVTNIVYGDKVSVYDINGKLIATEVSESDNTVFTSMDAGVYLIKINDGVESSTHKVIVL